MDQRVSGIVMLSLTGGSMNESGHRTSEPGPALRAMKIISLTHVKEEMYPNEYEEHSPDSVPWKHGAVFITHAIYFARRLAEMSPPGV